MDRAFAARIRRRYGLSLQDYRDLWRFQNGLCPICGKKLKRTGRGGACVDHDHKSKAVRGILCGLYCNKRVVGAIERAGKERTWNALVYLGWL